MSYQITVSGQLENEADEPKLEDKLREFLKTLGKGEVHDARVIVTSTTSVSVADDGPVAR